MGQIREAPRPDLAEVRAATPPAAGDALCRGLARQPEDRPATAGELVDALEAAFREQPEPDRGDDPTAVLAPVRDDPTRETPPRAEAAVPLPPRDETTSPPPGDAVVSPPPGDEAASAAPRDEATSEASDEDSTTEAPFPRPSPAHAATSSAGVRRSRLWPVTFGLLALAILAVGAVVLSSTGSDEPSPDRAGTPTATAPQETDQTTAPEEEPAKPPRADATPESAVRAFYTRAADGDLEGAWNLAGPRMRAQFNGSRAEFADTLGSLRSIRFITLEETGRAGRTATIRIETVAEHTTRTDRCTGTLQASRRGDGWRVEPAGVRCTQV